MARWIKKWAVKGSGNNTYTVSQAEDGTWGCSCPHWIHRRAVCKHIRQVQEGLHPDCEWVEDHCLREETEAVLTAALACANTIDWF